MSDSDPVSLSTFVDPFEPGTSEPHVKPEHRDPPDVESQSVQVGVETPHRESEVGETSVSSTESSKVSQTPLLEHTLTTSPVVSDSDSPLQTGIDSKIVPEEKPTLTQMADVSDEGTTQSSYTAITLPEQLSTKENLPPLRPSPASIARNDETITVKRERIFTGDQASSGIESGSTLDSSLSEIKLRSQDQERVEMNFDDEKIYTQDAFEIGIIRRSTVSEVSRPAPAAPLLSAWSKKPGRVPSGEDHASSTSVSSDLPIEYSGLSARQSPTVSLSPSERPFPPRPSLPRAVSSLNLADLVHKPDGKTSLQQPTESTQRIGEKAHPIADGRDVNSRVGSPTQPQPVHSASTYDLGANRGAHISPQQEVRLNIGRIDVAVVNQSPTPPVRSPRRSEVARKEESTFGAGVSLAQRGLGWLHLKT